MKGMEHFKYRKRRGVGIAKMLIQVPLPIWVEKGIST